MGENDGDEICVEILLFSFFGFDFFIRLFIDVHLCCFIVFLMAELYNLISYSKELF
jgi:hypothetical protein